MPEPLTLFARIAPKPEHLAAAREAVLDILPATRAEPGCRAFVLHDEGDWGGCLYLYEMWDDEAAFSAHHAQSYTQAVFDRYREWLSEPVDIIRLRKIGEDIACSS